MKSHDPSLNNSRFVLSLRALAFALLILSMGTLASGPVADPPSGTGPSGAVFAGRAGDAAAAPLDGVPQINGVSFKFQKQNGVILVCKLTLTGANYEPNCVVNINGQPAPKTLYTSGLAVTAKGGAKLSKMLPKHTEVALTIVNPGGQTSAPFPFTRP